MNPIIVSLLYAIIYAINLISFEFLDDGDTIIPNSIFILQFIESIIFLVGSLCYARFMQSCVSIDKYLFLSGFIYSALTYTYYQAMQYTNASFVNNLEFANIALNFFQELIMKTAGIGSSVTIFTIVLSGIIANYGVIGISPNANMYGYIFGISSVVIENTIGFLILKGGKEKLNNFISFNCGLGLSSLCVFVFEYIFTHPGNYNAFAYVTVVTNGIYLYCYFFVVDKFGVVFDSVTCNLSIILTLVFVVIYDDVYNILLLVMGILILLTNALHYIHVEHNTILL